jgi:hypothetical protein
VRPNQIDPGEDDEHELVSWFNHRARC